MPEGWGADDVTDSSKRDSASDPLADLNHTADADSTSEWSSVDRVAGTVVHTAPPEAKRRVLLGVGIGIVGLGVLFAVGVTRIRQNVQNSLAEQSSDALARVGSAGAEVSFSGRDAQVRVPADADLDKIRSALDITGIRTVEVVVDPSLAAATTTAVASIPRDIELTIDQTGRVVATGVIADESSKISLLAAIKAQSPAVEIDDQMTFGPGGVEGITALWAGKSIGEFRRVGATAAAVEASATELRIRGSVGSLAIRDSVNAFIAGSGLTISGSLQIERAPASTAGPSGIDSVAPDTLFGDIASESQQIQATLDTILAESSIQFQPDSASLTSGGQDAVVKIAEALKASPGARVTVTGHTDSNGDADRNLALSVSRAEAVRADLGQLGIDVARITTVGEGGEKPLVSNDTPANRKKNRRIEIRVD
jgi:outer membrane protein OmpA-like peptidoglycan-associated protein